MAIRLTGMSSGLDTDSMVQELTKAYSTNKDNIVKKKTKLEWTMNAWKETNTKVYDFYTTTLSPMRFSTTYNLKKASSSDDSRVTVTAGNNAPVGTQKLSVSKLASSGYLTGGRITAADGSDVKGSTKISELGITGAGTLNINGHEVKFDENTSLNALVGKIKDAGVSANFDEASGRFFISSSKSGADSEITITADDENGLDFLKSAGLISLTYYDEDGNGTGEETSDLAKYREIAGMSISDITDDIYDSKKYTKESYTAYIKNINETAVADRKKAAEKLAGLKREDYETEEKYNEAVNKLNDQISELDEKINSTTELLTDDTKLQEKMDEANAEIHAKAGDAALARQNVAVSVINDYEAGNLSNTSGSARIKAQDAKITLNGVEFTSSSNSFNINGLTIDVKAPTVDEDGKNTPITITTATDTQGIYDKIKSFLSAYNEMIGYIDTQYYADSAKGYEPLTDDEKEQMTDKQIEDWEKKVKDALLRKDNTLGNLSSALKNVFTSTSITKDGKTYNLGSFGIGGTNYFSTENADRGKFHIDGDKDDKLTSSNDDKLMAAIANDPEAVTKFFQELSNNLYKTLDSKMKSSSISSAFTIYNDKEMSSQYSQYTTKVSEWEEKLEKIQDSYYKKFAAMETALSKLQSQTTQLSQLFGG